MPAGSNLLVDENQEVKPGTGPLPMGPAQHPDSGRSRRQGPLRGRDRGRNDAHGKGPQRPRPPHDHGAQGRSAPAGRAGRRQRQDSRLLLPARKGPHRSHRRRARSRPARCWPRRPREVSGTQDITGGLPRVTEIFEARKPKDPAVIAEIDGTVELLGEKRRGKRTIIVRSESGIEREHLVLARQALARPRRRLRAGRRGAGRRAARAARHPAHLRRRGRAAVPDPRNPERLPQPARRNRRQAHRDHRRADAPQGADRDASATPACCRAA